MITLNDGVNPIITLPASMEWIDEYDWSNISQDVRRLIGGGIVISESQLIAGRPITLVGGDNVWVDKSVIDEIQSSANIIDNNYSLILSDLRTFNVVFNRIEPPFTAVQVLRINNPSSSDKYILTLRLMEI